MGIVRDHLGHDLQSIYFTIFCQFCKKIVSRLSKHSDVTKTHVTCYLANFRDDRGPQVAKNTTGHTHYESTSKIHCHQLFLQVMEIMNNSFSLADTTKTTDL